MIYLAVEAYASGAEQGDEASFTGGNTGRNNGLYPAGAAVTPDRIGLSTPRPDDFDAFWKAKLEAQAKVGIHPVLTPVQTMCRASR